MITRVIYGQLDALNAWFINFRLSLLVLRGWRRNALAFAFGMCATGASPPIFLFPLLIPAFAGLLLLWESALSPKRSFADGWWWGLGHYMTSLYWMCVALLTDPAQFGWLIPFTLVGLNGLLALYPALAALLWRLMAPAHRYWWPMGFATVWSIMELLRGYLFTGFPWNLAGYSWAFSNSISQSVSVIGIYGLTFLTVFAASALIAGWRQALTCWLFFVLIAVAGTWRLESREPHYVPQVNLRLVQANVAQQHKWEPAHAKKITTHYLALSKLPSVAPITHLIWPETAAPFLFTVGSVTAKNLKALAPRNGAFITGVIRFEGTGENLRLWNSMAIFSRDKPVTIYDKHRLVPFGEFVPLRKWLPNVVTPAGMVDFTAGPGPLTVFIPGAPPATPLICYEAIFPDGIIAEGNASKWFLNITNDAWFGNSSGPYQHFHMARFRAIEQGIPLVRSANTGISAVIDPYGRIIAKLGLGEAGVLDSKLPQAIENGTIYGSIGNKYFLLLMLLVMVFTFYSRNRHVS